MRRFKQPLHLWAASVLAGIVAGAVTLAVGALAGALVAPQTGPFLVMGNTIVDNTPEWLKSFAIETFGENDKLVLLASLGVVLAILSALAGIVQLWRAPSGLVLVALLGVVAVIAALNRPSASIEFAVPTLVGIGLGCVVLWLLVDRLRAARSPETPAGAGEAAPALRGPNRRAFLGLTAAAAVLAVGAALGSRRLGKSVSDVIARRDRIVLPNAVDPAPGVPEAVEVGVPGVTPFVSPNNDFYRVDTALQVPAVDPDAWTLRVHGMVDQELRLDYAELSRLPLIERLITLTCVSNQVGGDLADNATWLGYPTRRVLEDVGVHPDADMVLSTSFDGFTASTPLGVLMDDRDSLIAVGMNGEPLPLEHGFPVRMVVPGLYGYVSATKWLVDLEVTRFDRASAYWTDRGWAARAPIKTASRIDVPKSFAKVPQGKAVVAGVAWAQQRGIQRVEVNVDGGPWREARLAAEASVDTWRQWTWEWDAEPGRHTLRVRATDGTGKTQIQEQAPPFPNGATGWHSRVVEVI